MRARRPVHECKEVGYLGEVYLADYLREELEPKGLTVLQVTEDHHKAPFDIEVLEGSQIIVGIENKDITGQPQGVWQKRKALRRKKAYAQKHRVRKVLTTVTDRDRELIGYSEGLVSQRVSDFDFWKPALLETIEAARVWKPSMLEAIETARGGR
jgi:hypothetical protein